MPKILDKLVIAAEKKGVPKAMAYGMAVASLQKAGILKTGSMELTEKGKKMNTLLTPKQLAGHNRKKKSKKRAPLTKMRPSTSKAKRSLKPKKAVQQKRRTSKPKK
jgi:hypothetical protein